MSVAPLTANSSAVKSSAQPMAVSSTFQSVIDSAMALPPNERLAVAAIIEHSLDDELPPLSSDEFRLEWLAELKRRWEDYQSGREPSYSEDEVHAMVNAMLGR